MLRLRCHTWMPVIIFAIAAIYAAIHCYIIIAHHLPLFMLRISHYYAGDIWNTYIAATTSYIHILLVNGCITSEREDAILHASWHFQMSHTTPILRHVTCHHGCLSIIRRHRHTYTSMASPYFHFMAKNTFIVVFRWLLLHTYATVLRRCLDDYYMVTTP